MAESMAIYFQRANWAEITAVLSPLAQKGKGLLWYVPAQSDYSIIAYEYDTIFQEYEDDDLARIYRQVRGFPSATLCLELRRSKGDVACDHVRSLTIHLLTCFDGLADTLCGPDGGSQVWTLEEITREVQKDGQKFLDGYRRQSGRREP